MIAPKKFSILHDIHKSDQRIQVARRGDTHPIILWEDGVRSASSKGASNTRSAFPNDLGEVRGLRVFWVIILGFILAHMLIPSVTVKEPVPAAKFSVKHTKYLR